MPGWSRTRHGSIAGGVLLAAALTAAPLVAQTPPAGGAAAPAGELRPGLGLAAGEAPAIAAPAAAEQQALEEIEA